MSLLRTPGSLPATSIRAQHRRQCNRTQHEEAAALPCAAGLRCLEHAVAQPIEPCHVERSETSLIIAPVRALKKSEIESLASRAPSAALQLRSAQNNNL